MDPTGSAFYPSPDPSSGPTSPQTSTLASTSGSVSERRRRQSQTAIPPTSTTHLDKAPSEEPTVSLTFTPSLRFDGHLPDATIVSSDHVYFYVHRRRLTDASSNDFDGHLPGRQPVFGGPPPTVKVTERGDVVNVVLHTVYGLSCLHYGPSLDTINTALITLRKYGIPIESQATREQPLYSLILAHALYHPIETYTLAAHNQLEDVAVAASGHLLSYDISDLSDDLATAMGPVYLKRLVLLHNSRLAALRDILMNVPDAHPDGPDCGEYEQSVLTREWAYATAQLLWDAPHSKDAQSPLSSPAADEGSRPPDWRSVAAIPPEMLRAHLERTGEAVVCELCRVMLATRIEEAVERWSSVKATI